MVLENLPAAIHLEAPGRPIRRESGQPIIKLKFFSMQDFCRVQAHQLCPDCSIDIRAVTGIMIDDYSIIDSKSFRSPLIGLYTSFKELNMLKFEYAFILTCDNPFTQKSFIKYMINQCSESDACVPIWKNQFIEPLLSIYKVKPLLTKCADNLRKRDYKLSHLLDTKLKIKYISIEEIIKNLDSNLSSFVNINDSKDLDKINRKKRKKF